MPPKEEFQYTVRVVSEILESNGSSSMASVCGGSLSLMDAGVPDQGSRWPAWPWGSSATASKTVVLTDIIGDEDHYGDMDFKVTGTRDGVTALQMDIKSRRGDPRGDADRPGAGQAGKAPHPGQDECGPIAAQDSVSQYAPVITIIQIRPEKVRLLIGPGGKVIREISAATDSKIDVDDTGKVVVASPDGNAAKAAADMISRIVQEAEVGKLYKGKVRKIMDFGAFVEILPGHRRPDSHLPAGQGAGEQGDGHAEGGG